MALLAVDEEGEGEINVYVKYLSEKELLNAVYPQTKSSAVIKKIEKEDVMNKTSDTYAATESGNIAVENEDEVDESGNEHVLMKMRTKYGAQQEEQLEDIVTINVSNQGEKFIVDSDYDIIDGDKDLQTVLRETGQLNDGGGVTEDEHARVNIGGSPKVVAKRLRMKMRAVKRRS
ncbi:conserved hypothetical protein [Ricinus communis]|uniref:Uncharacterized protein n=1 Tax=Ricinus communis TaxID=3988 RepID=B9T3D1_RICCO|nr:conserved hypothetical protein [Ricinus communis]